MQRKILVYGAISGLIVILSLILALSFAGQGSILTSAYVGYLVMLVALSVIFVAVRQYRDRELGGIITFGTAFAFGAGIAAVAGCVYVITWEAYLAATDYAFVDDYIRAALAAGEARGATADELAALAADMDDFRDVYANPLLRLPMTFLEIFPVGLAVALVSALLLRRGPARA